MNYPTVLSVTQLNTYIKSVIDSDENLNMVFVSGEISNFTNHFKTGHFYMTVKDTGSSVKAVMFRSANSRLGFMPENGMKVLIRGRISVFERDGQYQLYIDDMQPDGIGALSIAFEQLKEKLFSEGLFDSSRKKAIPKLPKKIGVITSATGAVIEDIKNVISRRFPMVEIILAPVQVQGSPAAGQIVNAINVLNSFDDIDVIIIARGGGSIEDLWAFNEEIVARAVASSVIPVISAIGHETDYTICDFAADLRAPTPSAAAEICVPDMREQLSFINGVTLYCEDTVKRLILNEQTKLSVINDSLSKLSPENIIDGKIQTTDILSDKALQIITSVYNKESAHFSAILAKLDALSPIKVISRGYCVAYKNDLIVQSASELTDGDALKLNFADGCVNCTVKE